MLKEFMEVNEAEFRDRASQLFADYLFESGAMTQYNLGTITAKELVEVIESCHNAARKQAAKEFIAEHEDYQTTMEDEGSES